MTMDPDLNIVDAAAFHEGWRAGLRAAREAIIRELTVHPNDYVEGYFEYHQGLRKALILVSQIRPGPEGVGS